MEEKRISLYHYAIVAAFVFLFGFIPGFAGITPLGMAILGTFIGAIYGWMTIGMFWPSVIALMGIGMCVGMNQMLVAGFASIPFFGLIFCIPLINVCSETGAFSWIIDKVLTSKAMQGKGWLTVWVLFMLTFTMGFTNPIIMCMVICSFISSICKQVGIEKNEKFPIYVYLGVAFSGMLGQVLFPFVGTGLTLIMAYNAMFPGFPLDFISYLIFMLPMGVILITVYTLLIKFVFRVDASKLSGFKPDKEVGAINKDQKIALGIFCTFILLLIVSSLPLGAITTFLSKFGFVGISFGLLLILDLLRKEDGTQLQNVEKSLCTVPWGLVLMIAYIMVIATYMNTPETGIASGMAALLTPLTSLPPLVFIVVALTFAAIMTNFANNMIIIILVMPFMFNFASTIGLAPTGMIVLLFIMAQFALATPAASPVTAVAMGQEMAGSKEMTKAAIKVVPLMFIIGLCFGWPLITLIF